MVRYAYIASVLMLLALPAGLHAQVVDEDRSVPGVVSAYRSTGDNAIEVALYKKDGDRLNPIAIVEVKGEITFTSKGIKGGAENLKRIQFKDAKDKWLSITNRQLIGGRAVITTEDGKTYSIFNLGIGPFAGEITSGPSGEAPIAATTPLTSQTARGISIRGRLLDAAGKPLPSAELWVAQTSNGILGLRGDKAGNLTTPKTSTKQDGTFAADIDTVYACKSIFPNAGLSAIGSDERGQSLTIALILGDPHDLKNVHRLFLPTFDANFFNCCNDTVIDLGDLRIDKFVAPRTAMLHTE